MELTTDKIPLHVGAFSSSIILKLKASVSMSHCTSKVRSTRRFFKSKLTTEGDLSVTGTVSVTFLRY